MKKDKYTITLNNTQFEALERLLDYEIDQEYLYQLNSNNGRELDYLKELIDLYEALYIGQARSFIEATLCEDLVNNK